MKNLYTLLSLTIGVLAFSQNPLLFNKNWKIDKININNADVEILQSSDAYFFTFNSNKTLSYMSQMCGNLSGNITYNSNNNQFNITKSSNYTSTCSNSNATDIQDNVHLLLSKNEASNNLFNYNIQSESFGYSMRVTNLNGDYIDYKSFAPSQQLTDTDWVISSVTVAGTTYNKPANVWVGGTSYFKKEGNFRISYFNSGSGDVGYLPDNKFSKLSMAVTLSENDSQEVNQFDGLLLSKVFNAGYNNSQAYQYAITANGNQLTVTNSDGNYATFNKSALAVADINKTVYKVYPTPTSDVLNIENIKEKTLIKIIDSTGKLIKEVTADNTKTQQINIKELSSGIYYININNKIEKIIKK